MAERPAGALEPVRHARPIVRQLHARLAIHGSGGGSSTRFAKEAVAILARKPRSPDGQSTAYRRHAMRLAAAVARGQVTRYTFTVPELGGHPRYSRAEIEELRDTLATAGVGTRAAGRKKIRAAVEKTRAGLVNSTTAARRVGVSRQAVSRWGRLGLYGATKLGSEWYFEPDLLPSSPTRRPAVAPSCSPSLAEPVTFAGQDADDFLRGLPAELPPATISQLRDEVASAVAATSPRPVNAFFE